MNRQEFEYENGSSRCRERAESEWEARQEQAGREKPFLERLGETARELADFHDTCDREPF